MATSTGRGICCGCARLQAETGGITEFVPLPFLHMEAPLYLKGGTRQGPSHREAILMHAVARLALHPLIPNIQASWVKLGEAGLAAALRSGANDLGGTLMNESISRAAGGAPRPGDAAGADAGDDPRARPPPRPRTTLYADAPAGQTARSFGAAPLTASIEPPAGKRSRIGGLAARG